MGEDVANEHAVFAVLTECRPVGRNRLIEAQVAPFDLLP